MELIENPSAKQMQENENIPQEQLANEELEESEESKETKKTEEVDETEKPKIITEEIVTEGGDREDGNSELLLAIQLKLDNLAQLFEQKIMRTTYEEKITDQMHEELQRYKADFKFQLVKPILCDIIEIRDSILRMSSTYGQKPEDEQNIPLKTFRSYALDIQDILEKNDISIYESEAGSDFNPVKQRVIKKIKTNDEKLHGKIVDSISSGYDYLGKTISPEKVSVYIYEKTKEEGENE